MCRLVESLVKPVHAEQKRRLCIIAGEDYQRVAKKVREELGVKTSEQYLTEGIYSLQQYYAIALLDPANSHAISAALDPFWHAHILHSRQYMDFCNNVIGEYMHHEPLDRDNPGQMQSIRGLYNYTIEILGQLFGTGINPCFWPVEVTDEELICRHGGGGKSYPEVQEYRLFGPSTEHLSLAFA